MHFPEETKELLRRARAGDAGALEQLVACAHAGDPAALFAAGLFFDVPREGHAPRDAKRARSLFAEAAERGHVLGQYFLANMCDYGEGGDQDHATARHWYRTAAEHGLRDAQMHYARMLEVGLGGSADLEAAAEWYALAVQQGDELAATNLAMMHLTDRLKDSDEDSGLELLRFAADRLDRLAHLYLGEMYLRGRQVGRDAERAAFHFCVSAMLDTEDQAGHATLLKERILEEHPELRRGTEATALAFIQVRMAPQSTSPTD